MKKDNKMKMRSLLVAIIMLASAMFIIGLTPPRVKAGSADSITGTLTILWVNDSLDNHYFNGRAGMGAYVSGVVNISWTNDVDCEGGLNPITHNVTFSREEGGTWPAGTGNLSASGGNGTYYLWNTTSSNKVVPDGVWWINVTASTTDATADIEWVNATSVKVVVRNTLPGTPGVNIWQGGRYWLYNSTTTLANYYQQVISTPATSSLYAGAEDVDITLNNSLAWDSGETYYLWKPVYNGSKGTPALYNLDWVRYGTTPGQYVTGSSTSAMTFDNIDLDRAGLWLICEGSEDWGSGANYRTIETYNATGFAWFWVNTSKDYTLTVGGGVTDWNYNDSGDLTFTVKDSTSTNTESMVDVRCDQTGNSTYGESRYAETGTYTYTHGKNNTHFCQVGNYTAYAYVDTDYYTTANGKQYYTENAMDGTTDDAHYNETYGADANKNHSASWLSAYATSYNWSACGPWDPPEHNATVVPVVVNTNEPYTLVSTGNSTMYWGFAGEVNFTLGETSIGTTFPNSNVKIWIFDDDGVNVTQNFSIYESTDGGDNTGTVRTWVDGGTKRPGRITIHNDAYRSGYIHINMTTWGKNNTDNVAYGDNGTWKAIIYIDYNGDRNLNGENKARSEEWNTTVEWTVAAGPDAQFKWIDDDGTVGTDLWGFEKSNNDGKIPYVPTAASVPLDVEFYVYASDGSYFGQDPTGGYSGRCQSVKEAAENITISGNSLITGRLSDFPGYGLSTTACGYSGGVWSVPIVPTMSLGGGEITIQITAFNSTCSGTISIGGENYEANGSIVSVTPNEFMIDQENRTLTITVKNSETGVENPYTSVYLYYLDDGTITAAETIKPITAFSVSRVEAVSGVYTISFNTTQQTDNQTVAGFGSTKAPRNLTVFVDGTGYRDGYALIQMKPVNDLETHISTETFMAGRDCDDVVISCDFAGNSTVTPSTKAADKNTFFMKIVDENGDDVSGTTTSNGVLRKFYNTILTGAYSVERDNVYGITAGTYAIYAWNNTHNSEGHNATFVIAPIELTLTTIDNVAVTEQAFILDVDKNVSATFTVEYNGEPMNGTLRIDNVSQQGSGSTRYNKTWTNTSFAPSGTGGTDAGGNTSKTVTITNGVITINNITANYLPTGVSSRYVRFYFKPSVSGTTGYYAETDGYVLVTIPTVSASPGSLPFDAAAKLELTLTGRGTGLADVFVDIAVPGISGRSNGTTNDQGIVLFSFTPGTTGNIVIRVENRTSATRVPVTSWSLYLDAPSQTNEGESFTVTVKNDTAAGAAVAGATVTFNKKAYTTGTDGTATILAVDVPTVTANRDFTMVATKTGHAEDSETITVLNVPMLTVVAPSTVTAESTFDVVVADDVGNAIIGATVTLGGSTYTSGAQGIAKVTAPSEGTYTITASKTGFVTSDPVTITVTEKEGGIPGFELLTLIAAIGVAFILLRRRRH